MHVDAPKLLLPVGEKVGMRGLGALAYWQPSNPLTLPSPPRGEGK
jgi:hypothetical protein